MRLLTFLSFLMLFGCKDANVKTSLETSSISQVSEDLSNDLALEIYDFKGLKPFLNKEDDKTYVINFWATWCAPCVKELPYFEEINKKYKTQNVEVLLVSLDFPKHYDKKLKPFIKKHELKSKVIALDDPDQNTWIPAINKDWSGAIPATIIYNAKERKFYERSFNFDELEIEVQRFLQ